MIVNIRQENDGKFLFPSLQLDDNAEWVIRLLNFTAIFNKPVKVDSIYQITTNIVRRTTGNPRQILNFMALPQGTKVINHSPAHALQYKIRFHELEASFIKVAARDQSQEIFADAAIQLEILRHY